MKKGFVQSQIIEDKALTLLDKAFMILYYKHDLQEQKPHNNVVLKISECELVQKAIEYAAELEQTNIQLIEAINGLTDGKSK